MSLLVWLPLSTSDGYINKGLYNVSLNSVGSPTFNTTGGKTGGGSYSFNESSNSQYFYKDCDLYTRLNHHSFSICAWIKKTVEANYAVLHVTFGIRFFTYGFILYDSSGYMTCSSSASVVDGNWHHICAVYDDETLKMYFYTDGVLTGTNTCSRSYASSWTNGLFVARDPNSSGESYWYNGHLNDVRIYDHALSPKEIKELSKGLVLHFPCNENYQVLNNAFNYPTFNTSSSGGGWNHWPYTNNTGTYSQNTNREYIYRPSQTYSHYFEHTSGDNYYICYQYPAFEGGYRSVQAIVKMPDGGSPVNDVTFGHNSNVGTIPPVTYESLGNGFWLMKREGFQQNGSDDLVCITVMNNKGVYVSEMYLENDRKVCSDIFQTNAVVHDTSGYDNHGSITGTLTCETGSPRYDYCTKFEGHNCYFLAKNPFYNNVQPCTIAFWFKPNSSNATYNTIISNTSPHGGFWISANTEGAGCWSYNAGTYIHGASGTLSNDVWYHMVWQYKGNNQYQWYLNGKAITTTISGTAKAPTFTQYFNIGGCQCSDSATSSNKFDQYGSISDIRIYANALSESDINELYNTSALFDNCDNMMGYQLSEKYTNMLALEEYGIATKQWLGCLSSYTQSHCKCTLTDDGYRIYRTPDLVYPDAGTVMWGGFIIRNSNSNVLNLQEGHRYMIQFEIKGQTTNGFGDSLGWTNQAGWPGGGLIPSPTNAEWICPITANYQSDEWKTFTYKWTISDTVYKVCTTTYSGYTAGETYLSYRDFKIGFGYASTGSLGTDLYIRNIRMYDITDGEPANIYQTGIVEMTGFVEENGHLRIMNGGSSVSEQFVEL